MKRWSWGLTLALALFLPAHAGLVLQSKSGTDEADAKLFTPDPTRGLVYASRTNAFKGKQAVAKLIVNDKVVAENGNNQFSVIAMKAGSYELGCAAGNNGNLVVGLIHNQKKDPLPLTVEAGQIYYVQQTFKALGGFTLSVTSAETAQSIIKKAALSAMIDLQ